MGYGLYIGNADLSTDGHDLFIDVKDITLEEAPDYKDFFAKGNSRHPSYTGWSEFAKEVGLYSYFFHGDDAVIRDHPGEYVLTQSDVIVTSDAKERYRESNREVLEKIELWEVPNRDRFTHEENIKYNYVRLDWLEFWIRYSVENFEIPIFKNI
jgi:hypothetical protein